MSNATTNLVARAELYRAAAVGIESMAHFHACHAIYVAAGLGLPTQWSEREPCEFVDAFEHLFKPEKLSDPLYECSWGLEWGEERYDCRVVALCFMAAMVEAGDA